MSNPVFDRIKQDISGNDVVLRDVLLDAIEDRVGHGRGHASVSFRLSYFGMAVCRARACSWSPILPRSAW